MNADETFSLEQKNCYQVDAENSQEIKHEIEDFESQNNSFGSQENVLAELGKKNKKTNSRLPTFKIKVDVKQRQGDRSSKDRILPLGGRDDSRSGDEVCDASFNSEDE